MKAIALRIFALIWRVYRKLNKEFIHLVLPLTQELHQQGLDLKRYGTDYGGWTVPVNHLTEESICYCVGVGVDASFDFALVENFSCNVFSFDPTELAIQYMEESEYDRTKLSFHRIGVWDENKTLKLFAPANPAHTSSSVYDLHGTNKYVEIECKTLKTIMLELGHSRLDLLKLDIEGAWKNVVENIVNEEIDISILCIELDSPVSLMKVRRVIKGLAKLGFVLSHFEKDNYLFVKKQLLDNENESTV